MKKELSGSELAGFIKERQAKAIRGLKQQWRVLPKLAIIRTNPERIVDSYMKIKTAYGEDIGVDVEVFTIDQSASLGLINKLNKDNFTHGIIVQIPLPNRERTEEVLNAVKPEKDVDGLAKGSEFDAPTPVAINWLLSGHNIQISDKNIVIVGNGRLVGRPLAELWRKSGLKVEVVDRNTPLPQIAKNLQIADVIVSATGVAGLIKPDMIKPEVTIIDAGISTDSNGLTGDVDQSVRELPEITITPLKGGVGPLTVAALFENLITAARLKTQTAEK